MSVTSGNLSGLTISNEASDADNDIDILADVRIDAVTPTTNLILSNRLDVRMGGLCAIGLAIKNGLLAIEVNNSPPSLPNQLASAILILPVLPISAPAMCRQGPRCEQQRGFLAWRESVRLA